GDKKAAAVVRRLAVDLETVGAVEAGKLQSGAEARGMAEHDIAGARRAAVRGGAPGAPDETGDAVAVHVAGRGARPAAEVGRRLTVDLETVGAVEAGKLQRRAEGRIRAEHHIGGARSAAVRVGQIGAHDQIGETIAVDVPSRGNRAASLVTVRL